MSNTAPIFLIILSVAIFYLYLDPAYTDIQQLQINEKAYTESIESVRAVEEKRNKLVSKYNSFSSADLNRLEQMIPSSIDNVRLVAEINGIAEQYDIEIRQIRTTENAQEDLDIYRTLTLSFTFDASYDSFIKFVNDLEQSLRILDFSLMSFRSQTGTQKMTYNVTLRTYWLP